MSGSDLIGHKFGNYVVTKLIGRGGMGAVYLAEHPEIGRKVAVKVLAPHLGNQPGLAQRFVAEAKAIARIDHPNIIDIYDFGRTDDGLLFYVMERLKGGELASTIRERRRMWPHEVVPFLQQICDGLQAAHDEGIVHRDLKPQNIFVVARKNLELRILDFGLAKLMEQERNNDEGLTATGTVMGSPLTIAPEQAAGELEKIGKHTDLYSLGIIVYWMLAGRPPFINSPTAVLMTLHIHVPPPPLESVAPWVSSDVAKTVMRCLEKAPENRPASAEAFFEEFAAAAKAAEGEVDPELFNAPTNEPQFYGDDSDAISATGETSYVSGQLQRLAEDGTLGQASIETQAGGPESLTKPPLGSMATVSAIPQTSQNPGASDFDGGTTTLSGAVGEVSLTSQKAPRKRSRIWVLGAALGLCIAIAGGWTYYSGTLSDQPRKGVQRAAHAPTQLEPAQPDIPSANKPQVFVVGIVTAGAQASCEARIGGRKQELQLSPCKFHVQENDTLDLNVIEEGYRSFQRKWRVTGAETIALRLLPSKKLIITEAEALKLAPTAAPSTATAATKPPAAETPRAKKPRRRPQRKPKTRASSPTSEKVKTKTAKAKRLKLGEGVPLGSLNE
jgi:serine/threonine protein kinase